MNKNFSEKRKLAQKLKDSGSLQQMLNAAAFILENPVFMFDTSYILLGYSEGVITDDPLVNELVQTGTFSHETVNFFNTEKFILSYANSETVSLMRSSKLKYERLNAKLFNKDNVQVANMLVVALERPFAEGDMELVEILSGPLSEKLLTDGGLYNKISKVYQEDLLFDCIRAGGECPLSAKELSENNFLAVVDITHYDPTTTHLAYFKDRLMALHPNYYYFVDLSNIIIVMSIREQIFRPQKHLKEMIDFFARNNLYAGISGRFSDTQQFKRAYSEAINALNYGLTNKRLGENFFFYDDFRTEHFLNAVKETCDFSEMCCPVVSLIQAHDLENGTQLLNTFYNYMLYGRDRAKTAVVLGISPKEVTRQIGQIKNRFGIDFHNGNTLLNMFLSAKMFYTD